MVSREYTVSIVAAKTSFGHIYYNFELYNEELVYQNRFEPIGLLDYAEYEGFQKSRTLWDQVEVNALVGHIRQELDSLQLGLKQFRKAFAGSMKSDHCFQFLRICTCNLLVLSTIDWPNYNGILDLEFKYHKHFPNLKLCK
jgi:hypothetical protein